MLPPHSSAVTLKKVDPNTFALASFTSTSCHFFPLHLRQLLVKTLKRTFVSHTHTVPLKPF